METAAVALVQGVYNLAIGCALSLAGVDVIYAVRGRTSRIYLVDATRPMRPRCQHGPA